MTTTPRHLHAIGNVDAMSNHELITLFHAWLLSTDRLASTIALRMRYVQQLSLSVSLATVSLEQLEQVMTRHRNLASETRKSMLASWRLFFDWARKRGIRRDDPLEDMESVKVRQRIPRIAPDAAIAGALIGASPRDRALVMLARYACLRLNELTTLHTRDREGEWLRVLGKGDKERLVGINEPLMRALIALEDEQGRGYYFPGLAGEHMHPQSVYRVIVRATGWNPHALRHAGATAAYNATKDLRAVQVMLGHASLATTQRYLHVDAEALRRVAAATVIPARVAA